MSLEYREFRPSPALSGRVECYWSLRGESPRDGVPDRILPDGRTELIWNLADPFHRCDPGRTRVRQSTALLVGQVTAPLFLLPGHRISLIGVRFRAAALGSFLGGMRASEITDRDLSLEDVLDRRLKGMGERLAGALPGGARIRVLDEALRSDLGRTDPLDPVTDAAVDWILGSHGRIRIDEVAARTGMSGRQLERRFLSAVGIGPKRLARISRFQHLLARIHEAERSGWSRLASACGYYDQAHLIRDFREFSASAPGEFLDSDHRLAELFIAWEG